MGMSTLNRIPIALFVLALAGCGGHAAPPPVAMPAVYPAPAPIAGYNSNPVLKFSDIPVPPQNVVDLQRTVMTGTDRYWFGRVSLTTPLDLNATYDFYRREMPPLGWAALSSIRGPSPVLSFEMNDRIATIQLS